MRNLRSPFSAISIAGGVVGALAVGYLTLIAVVMSYAALTIEFSQSVRGDEAAVAGLESQYLDVVAHVTAIDYTSAGYAKPIAEAYVTARSVTALR